MAFPTLVSSTGGIFTTSNSLTFAPSLGFTANANDLIVVAVSEDDATGGNSHTYSGGYTKLYDSGTIGSFSVSLAYYVAAGGETGVPTITAINADHWAILIWRITGGGTPEETHATGVSTTPNPPTLTPSGGSSDYLWLAGYGVDTGSTQRTNTADPAGYTNIIESREVSTSGAQIRGGSRTNTAASEDPGSFTLDGSENWTAFTIAVPPSGPPPASALNQRMTLGVGG
jgi:hypothetical protein